LIVLISMQLHVFAEPVYSKENDRTSCTVYYWNTFRLVTTYTQDPWSAWSKWSGTKQTTIGRSTFRFSPSKGFVLGSTNVTRSGTSPGIAYIGGGKNITNIEINSSGKKRTRTAVADSSHVKGKADGQVVSTIRSHFPDDGINGYLWYVYSHAENPSLTISPTTAWNVAAAASLTRTVKVTSNVSWSVTKPAWVSVSKNSGSNNGNFTITTTENMSGRSRSGTVSVTGGGITRKFTVTQAGTSQNTALTYEIDNDISNYIYDRYSERGVYKKPDAPSYIIAMGIQYSGGYAIRITGVRIDDNENVVVTVEEHWPPPGSITTDAITYPVCEITFNRSPASIVVKNTGQGYPGDPMFPKASPFPNRNF